MVLQSDVDRISDPFSSFDKVLLIEIDALIGKELFKLFNGKGIQEMRSTPQ